MFKAMIVEDDQLYRYEIRNFIDWEKNGYTIIGEAMNGKHALQLIEQEVPDVVFTDISMPGMNGISLIREMRRSYPYIKIVVLSSYDDFCFVKDAMKLGAIDYILKHEMKKEEFCSFLKQLNGMLLKDQEEKRAELFLEENKYRIAHEYLRDILNGQIPEEEQLLKNMKSLDLEVDHSMLAVMDIRFYKELCPVKGVGERKKIDFMNRQDISFSPQSILLKIHDYEYAVLKFFGKERSQIRVYDQICEEAKRFARAIEKNEVGLYSIGISDTLPGWRFLKQAYDQSVHAAERKFFQGYGKILFYSSMDSRHRHMENMEEGYYQNLLKLLEEGRMDTALNRVKEYFAYMEACDFENERVKDELLRHLNLIYKVTIEEKIGFERISGEFSVNQNLLDRMDTSENALYFLTEYMEKLKASLNYTLPTGHLTHKKEILSIKKYIENNYMNEINLNLLSEELNFTPSYICKIFKKNTGMHIKEYLNQIRIEQAKRLIKQTNLKVYEIAEMVGFSRTSYFCTTFKKVTGVKISEYKESL
nr:response regulator [uncultured Schaedlerella sp.]